MKEVQSFLPYIQVSVSIGTLILTPLFSALVVRYQLARNQSYWKEQQRHLRDQEQFKIRIEQFQRTVGCANRFYDRLVSHHIFISCRYLSLVLSDALRSSNPEAAKYYRQEYEDFRQKAAQSYLDIRELSVQLTEQAALLRVFFGDEVSDALARFRDKGNTAINPAMSDAEMLERFNTLVNQGTTADDAKRIIEQEYDARQNTVYPKSELQLFISIIVKCVDTQKIDEQQYNTSKRKRGLVARLGLVRQK